MLVYDLLVVEIIFPALLSNRFLLDTSIAPQVWVRLEKLNSACMITTVHLRLFIILKSIYLIYNLIEYLKHFNVKKKSKGGEIDREQKSIHRRVCDVGGKC